MSDNDLNARIESLEARLMHQEASIDELTRALWEQEKRVKQQTKVIKHLEDQLKDLAPSSGPALDETPPHY